MGKAAVLQSTIGLESNAGISAPLMTNFKSTSLIEDFLYSVLTCIIVFLAILSSQLLYSLMLSDVDMKTYEYGMLRALGFKSGHLMSLITIQSFVYSIPGIFCGLCVALIINMGLRAIIFEYADNSVGFWLTTASVIIGITYGLFMPLLAIILPIQQALGKNLRNSLDLNHRA
jgi:ABC-type antimicrobial peptide transport system permease subunit